MGSQKRIIITGFVVREACLESIPVENPPQQMVPVRPEVLCVDEKTSSDVQPGLNISTKGFSVHVTESPPMGLLATLVEAQTGNRPYVPDTLYLFCGRRTDRIKGLVWEGDG